MNKNNKFRLGVIAAVFITIALGTFFSTNAAFANIAENWSDSAVQKALLKGLHRCYSTGAINYDAGKLSEFKNFNQLVIGGTDQDYVALPSGLTNVGDNNLDCKSLFQGWSSFKGIFELAGKPEYKKDITGVDQKITFLEGMGYSKVDDKDDNKKCVVYWYTADYEGKSDKKYTAQVCYTDENGLSVEDSGGTHTPYFEVTDKYTLKVSATLKQLEPETVRYVGYTFGGENSGWSGFVFKLNNTMSTYFNFVSNDYLQFDSNGAEQNNYGDAVFKLKSSRGGGVADRAISFLSSYKNYDDLAFTDKEKLSYFVGAIKNWFYSGMSTSDYLKCDISDWSLYGSYLQINIDINTMKKSSTCGIDTSRIPGETYAYGFDGNQFDASGATKLYLTDVVKEINSLVDGLDDEDLADLSTTVDDDTKPEDTCMNSGGAGSLGWIACPILDWVSDSVQNIYSSAVAPLLQVDSKFFSNDEDVGTFHAWGIFQSMANIVFIILFLFVIFSQLTGVGIDNYGIKKIMPKLVVAAVLINLSYLICLICVDISNIAGNGIQSLFNGLDPGGSAATFIDEYNGVTSTHTEEVVTSSGAGATALTAVALVAILAGGFIAIWHNPALLLSLLVSALGVLIAILFLFVLLAGREAAIIVLTVISPLAFVCYILPNTKKFFDKWLKFWEGLLLVYPICGLLVGGGDFVSRLLLSIGFADSNFFMGFVTMIVGIIPIFFIPTVLKGAFAAMGNIGSAFANLGRTARGAATDKIRKSEGYKAVQQQGLDRSVRSKAGYSRRNDRLNAKGRLKSRFAKTGFARALGYGGLQSARVKAASGIVDEEVESRASVEQALAVSGIAKKGGDVKGYYGDMLEKAGKSGSANNVNAVVAAMVNSGQIKEKDIADLMRKHINDGNIKIRNDGTMANVFREMATKYGSGFLSTDAELKDFMQKGGLDKSGNKISSLGNYGDYAKAGHMDATDIKKEDVTKLSGDSLSGLIKSGVLDQGMAQQMLAMNPNISNDKRIMLGAAANNLDISSMTAEQFKEAAKSVAQKPDDASTLIQGMSSEMAKALTSATPQSVNVVQNFRGGGRQIEPVDVNLRSNYREPSGYDDDTSTWD